MNANDIINQFGSVAHAHPSIALGFLLIIMGALIRGKTALIFYLLGALALINGFGLFTTFVSFLKQVPHLVSQVKGV